MSYSIALNFEDGVTRFIECNADETVLDAAYRNRINLPMDCSDGVCGTCKCKCDIGDYDLGDDFIDEALTEDEADERLVLTCQMKPRSDCVVAVPVPSTACKTAIGKFQATLLAVNPHEDSALEVTFCIEPGFAAPVFLPGQYVNIEVPGSGQTRAYSFSSAPGASRFSFLVKRVPSGLMSSYLDRAQPGEQLTLTGPLGSFYLREPSRSVLMLAGGTGLAPILSMLEVLAQSGCTKRVQLVYGVTRVQDLVLLERLEALRDRLPNFDFMTCVTAPDARHPRKGYVTDHLSAAMLHDGDVDIYLCGPPPMVDSVRSYLDANGVEPASFYYEKFNQAQILAA
jgi:benzoate/toluate 1,2-dioxygenase reductase subunit